jgi:hypothetical protein
MKKEFQNLSKNGLFKFYSFPKDINKEILLKRLRNCWLVAYLWTGPFIWSLHVETLINLARLLKKRRDKL